MQLIQNVIFTLFFFHSKKIIESVQLVDITFCMGGAWGYGEIVSLCFVETEDPDLHKNVSSTFT